MLTKRRFPLPLLAATLLLAPLGAQLSEEGVSARDVFRSAKNRFYVEKAENKPPAPPPRPAETKQAAAPAPTQTKQQPSRQPPPDEPRPIPVAYSESPLGLRYSLLRRTPDGGAEEVDVDTVFRSGESIRIEVESSDEAYLYIVTQGSSGRWSVLFPSQQIAGGANQVDPDGRYIIPPGGWFSFDDNVGEERVFIMLSRQPVDDLEKVIYELREPARQRPAPRTEESKEPVMLAQNIPTIPDSLIADYRQVYSRDLVFEKVDDEAQPPATSLSSQAAKPEKAVYVVTKKGGDDARVIADLRLEHR